MSLRTTLNEALKTAMREKDDLTRDTIRLINSELKKRDIDSRTAESREGLGEPEILQMMQTMVKQRQESAAAYRQGAREDLAAKEEAEIVVIQRFMPTPLDAAEAEAAIQTLITELGAAGPRDMGRVMTALRERFAGRMDFTAASATVKAKLTAAASGGG